jgi:hypothetical protein
LLAQAGQGRELVIARGMRRNCPAQGSAGGGQARGEWTQPRPLIPPLRLPQ